MCSGENKAITRLLRSTLLHSLQLSFSSVAFTDPSVPSSIAKFDIAQHGGEVGEGTLGVYNTLGLKCCLHAFLSKGLCIRGLSRLGFNFCELERNRVIALQHNYEASVS